MRILGWVYILVPLVTGESIFPRKNVPEIFRNKTSSVPNRIICKDYCLMNIECQVATAVANGDGTFQCHHSMTRVPFYDLVDEDNSVAIYRFDDGYKLVGNNLYKPYKTPPLNFSEANQTCHDEDGILAIGDTPEREKELQYFMKSLSVQMIWVGLYASAQDLTLGNMPIWTHSVGEKRISSNLLSISGTINIFHMSYQNGNFTYKNSLSGSLTKMSFVCQKPWKEPFASFSPPVTDSTSASGSNTSSGSYNIKS